jgi:hypothetical protein
MPLAIATKAQLMFHPFWDGPLSAQDLVISLRRIYRGSV